MNDNTKYITPRVPTLIGLSWIFRDLQDLMGDNKSQYDFELVHELAVLDNSFHTLFEANCNGLYNTEEEYNAEFDKLESRLKEITTHFNWYYYIQTDPRGASLYISTNVLTDTNYNSYTSQAFNVSRLTFEADEFLTLNEF